MDIGGVLFNMTRILAENVKFEIKHRILQNRIGSFLTPPCSVRNDRSKFDLTK
jgi:hypothetical protein